MNNDHVKWRGIKVIKQQHNGGLSLRKKTAMATDTHYFP